MRLKLTVLSIPLFLLLAVPVVRAEMMEGDRAEIQAERAELRAEREEQAAERQEQMEERQAERAERCVEIEAKIEERLEKYAEVKMERVENYQNMTTRLETLLERLADSNLDTSGLEAEIDQMKEMTSEVAANAEQAMESLRMSQQYACGESQGQFASTVDQARQEFRMTYESAQALRDHYLNELRPALLALREQAKQQAEQGGM